MPDDVIPPSKAGNGLGGGLKRDDCIVIANIPQTAKIYGVALSARFSIISRARSRCSSVIPLKSLGE